MTEYTSLREANIARQKIWDPNDAVDLDWRANELMGEIGEVCNVIKKLYRERIGLPGSRDTVEHLAEELADVVICLDLALLTYVEMVTPDVPVYDRARKVFRHGGPLRITASGAELGGMAGRFVESMRSFDTSAMYSPFIGVVIALSQLATDEDINLDVAVAKKFNATSTKMGFDIFLTVPDST